MSTEEIVLKMCLNFKNDMHPYTDCFAVSQLFSVVRNAGRFNLGSKPA